MKGLLVKSGENSIHIIGNRWDDGNAMIVNIE
jgi:hypothetical protein